MQRNFSSPIAIIAAITACWRFWRLMLCKDRDHLFADGALFAGVGYAFAFCLLKLSATYYMTPANACWAVASASYLANALPDLNNAQSYSVSRDRSYRLAKLSMGVVLVAVFLQGFHTKKCIKRQVNCRIESVQLVKLFNDLDREGVHLVAYMPSEIKRFARCVQHWRRHTMNIFADCEANQLRPINRDGPFIFADMQTIQQIPGRKLVVCPPEYAHRFCSGKTQGQLWQRLDQYPRVMGAYIYVQNFEIADLSSDARCNVVAKADDRSLDQTNIK